MPSSREKPWVNMACPKKPTKSYLEVSKGSFVSIRDSERTPEEAITEPLLYLNSMKFTAFYEHSPAAICTQAKPVLMLDTSLPAMLIGVPQL